MKLLNLCSILVLVLVVLLAIARLLTVKVEIGQAGVLTEEWGDGLVHEDFGPGLHWGISALHRWDIFDTTVQTLSMTKATRNAFQVKSADGATVTMDVTIKFRIDPGKCWELLRQQGPGNAYKEKVRNQAIDALRPVFGSMKTEHFYSPEIREEKAAAAETLLGQRLGTLNVDLVAILVRDVSFDKEYEERIKSKTITAQQEQVNIALTEAAKYRGDTDIIKAETKAKVTVINEQLEKTRQELTSENEKKVAAIVADAEKYAVEQRADADLYAAEKRAAGDLLVKNAEAEAQQLRNTALRGDGASNLVALEAARNLKLGTIVLSTLDNNFLDIWSLARKLGAKVDTTEAAATGNGSKD